jgi:uncharacterized repeat protein (TIGR03803 family)
MRLATSASVILAAALLAACSHGGGLSPLPSAAGAPAARADAGGFKSLYSFQFPPDAELPVAGMVASGGTLYGTTQEGGRGDAGAVFATSTTGKEHVVYGFGTGGGADGVFPVAGLVVLGGKFYGTAFSGGTHGFGAVFSVDKSGNESQIYSFAGGKDGDAPSAALVVFKDALYGTTTVGGGSAKCSQGCGTVFEVTTAGKEHVLHAFKGSDGIGPVASLIPVGSELYGTTPSGGKNGDGAIFKISASGKLDVIYSFKGMDDGGEPEASLVSVGGKLYGTTNEAGKNFNGTVFVTTTGGSESAIYSFRGGNDGANPEAALIAVKGKLYGTTAGGGSGNSGTIFSVTTSGTEHVLHSFASSEGSDPRAPLVALNGTLYGTASGGGTNGLGAIFKVSP